MTLPQSLAALLVTLVVVHGLCDPEVIRAINRLQKGRPPSHILSRLVGTTTYLYIPSFNQADAADLACYQTVLDYDERSATDFLFFTDPARNQNASYEMVEHYGMLTLLSPGEPDDFMYVVSLEEGVMGFYQCGGPCERPGCDYQPFLSVGVLDYDPWDNYTARIVEQTVDTLSKLDVPILDRIKTRCHAEHRAEVSVIQI